MGRFRLSTLELSAVTRQLAMMVNVGVPIHRALRCCARAGRETTGEVMDALANHLAKGNYLSRCLGLYPELFSASYVGVVQAGERSGTLGECLNRLSVVLENQARLQGRLQAALTYPAVVTGFSFAGAAFFACVLFPGMRPLYDGLGIQLPLATQILIAMRWVVPLCVAVGLATWFWGKRFRGWTLAGWLERVPILNELISTFRQVQVLRTLVLLLNAGIPFAEAMELSARSTGSEEVASRIGVSVRLLYRGMELEECLKRSGFFRIGAIQCLAVGEESTGLAMGAQLACELMEHEAETAIATLTSLVEPVATVAVGLMVGAIVMGAVLPTLKLMQTL